MVVKKFDWGAKVLTFGHIVKGFPSITGNRPVTGSRPVLILLLSHKPFKKDHF